MCIFHADLQNCPVELRLLAQIRSPHHSAKRFAVAHLLGGQRIETIPRNEVEVAAPKTNGRDPTPTHSNGNGKHDGRRRHQEMLALRVAAAAPAAHRSHARAEKPPAGLTQKPALASRSLGAAAARDSVPTAPKNSVQVTTLELEDPKMSTSTPTTSAPPTPAARLCQHQHPKCTRELSAANRSGYCVAHRDLHRSHRKNSSNGHNRGHHAAKPNGAGKSNGKSNGHEDRLIAQRVKALLSAVELPLDCVLEIIPDEDKKVFVENWLLAREGAA